MYFNGMFNVDEWDDSVAYAIFDDFNDWSLWFTYKQFLGAQEEFVVTDKYRGKRTVKWGKPCVLLSNEMPLFKDMNWVQVNCFIVDILDNKLF